MFVGVDIGGTKTAVLLVDGSLRVVDQVAYETRGKTLAIDLVEALQQLLAAHQLHATALFGMGIGIPGRVEPQRGSVSMAVNLGIQQSLPLVQQLHKHFSLPILLENDVRLAAVGLSHRQNIDNFAYLNVGTGISAGVVLNGRLHRGVAGMAGEIGHIPVDEEGNILEHWVSGPSLIRQAQAAGLAVQHPSELYRLASQADNAQAAAIIRRASSYLSQAIVWLLMAYDVEQLVLGGGVTKVGPPFFNPILTALAKMRQQSLLIQQMVPDSKISLLAAGTNPGLWGAVALAKTAVKNRTQSKNDLYPQP